MNISNIMLILEGAKLELKELDIDHINVVKQYLAKRAALESKISAFENQLKN